MKGDIHMLHLSLPNYQVNALSAPLPDYSVLLQDRCVADFNIRPADMISPRPLSEQEVLVVYLTSRFGGASTLELLRAHCQMRGELLSPTALCSVVTGLVDDGVLQMHRLRGDVYETTFFTVAPTARGFIDRCSGLPTSAPYIYSCENRTPVQLTQQLMGVCFVTQLLSAGVDGMRSAKISHCDIVDYAAGKVVRSYAHITFANQAQMLFEPVVKTDDWMLALRDKLQRYECVYGEQKDNTLLILSVDTEDMQRSIQSLARDAGITIPLAYICHTALATGLQGGAVTYISGNESIPLSIAA